MNNKIKWFGFGLIPLLALGGVLFVRSSAPQAISPNCSIMQLNDLLASRMSSWNVQIKGDSILLKKSCCKPWDSAWFEIQSKNIEQPPQEGIVLVTKLLGNSRSKSDSILCWGRWCFYGNRSDLATIAEILTN